MAKSGSKVVEDVFIVAGDKATEVVLVREQRNTSAFDREKL